MTLNHIRYVYFYVSCFIHQLIHRVRGVGLTEVFSLVTSFNICKFTVENDVYKRSTSLGMLISIRRCVGDLTRFGGPECLFPILNVITSPKKELRSMV